jgi:iron complex transport system ATP-binding protein
VTTFGSGVPASALKDGLSESLPRMHPSGEPLLEIQNASVTLDNGRRVLDSVDLRIGVGEHAAILGPNGSGKSSLVKLIAHQHYPHTGQNPPPVVRVLGRDRWNISELRSKIGVVSADLHALFPTEWRAVSAEEAVVSSLLSSFSLFSHHEVTQAMRERARETLALMGVEYLAKRPITEMSTGELRRVIIARALAPDPHALLLDEPTTGLDLVARHRFLESIREIAGRGKTIILVTHRIEEVIPETKRLVLLRDGRVHRDGAPRELLTSEAFGELFGGAVEVRRGPAGYYQASVG